MCAICQFNQIVAGTSIAREDYYPVTRLKAKRKGRPNRRMLYQRCRHSNAVVFVDLEGLHVRMGGQVWGGKARNLRQFDVVCLAKESEILFAVIPNSVVDVGRVSSNEVFGHIASARRRVSRIHHLGCTT